MSKLGKHEQAAIDAVANHFAGTWERETGGSPSAHLTIAGKRIAIEIVAIESKIGEDNDSPKPRLRFDKVVQRLIGRLRAALSESVPDGMAVIMTCTAPILLPGKTAAALESKIRGSLARPSARVDFEETINGNRIRVCFARGVSKRLSKVVGFVHNPDSDPDVLFRLTRSMLKCIGAAEDRRQPAKFHGDRLLVIASSNGYPHVETYRYVHEQLSSSATFKKILIVFPGGRIEALTG